MAKFKIGDIVVGNENNPYRVTGKGVRCKVVGVCTSDHIKVKNHGDTFDVSPRWFDLVHSNSDDDEITITRHGNKVVAKYGKKVGVAKCSPDDTFDFATGAKLAFKRLMGESEYTQEPKQIFKEGEFVRIIGDADIHFFAIGSIVQIKNVYDHNLVECFGLAKEPDPLGYSFCVQTVRTSAIEHLPESSCIYLPF